MDTTVALDLMRIMKKIRLTEETIAEKYSEWKMRCPTHLCSGQEAVSAGIGHALRNDDFAMSTHRSHGHYLGKGGNLNRMLAEIYGKETGCSSGKGGSMHLIDQSVGFMGSTSIVGGSIPLGVGLGLSIKLNKTDQVSCVFFGDAATETGVFYESVNFAVLKNLPVLFICENNLYSVYSPLNVRQPENRKIFKLARELGVQSEHGDGNDVLDVYQKATNAITKIRHGEGPYFFEFTTYRWREHCGPNFDNDIGYRTEKEYLVWKERDPIGLLAEELRNNGVRQEEINLIEESVRQEVDQGFSFAEESAFPPQEDAFKGLYA